MKKIISLLLVFAFCFLMFSCDRKESDPQNAGEDEIVLPTPVIKTDISLPYTSAASLDPFESDSRINREIIPVIFEGLFSPSEDGRAKPVCSSGADMEKLSVRVSIVAGLKFSDGEAVTPEDIKKSFELAAKSKYYSSLLSNITGVEIEDGSVVFNLGHSDEAVLNVLSFPIVKKIKGGYIGTGRYALKKLDGVLYLEANKEHPEYSEDWNKQIALFDMSGVDTPIYPFKSNKISVYTQDLSDGNYINLSGQTIRPAMTNFVYLGINSSRESSQASLTWLRQAIYYGINRVYISKNSYLGQAKPTDTPCPRNYFALGDDKGVSLEGNVQKAVSLFEKNGYDKLDENKIRTNGSTKLSLTLLVCTENQYKEDVAEAVKETLGKIGINVIIYKRNTAEAFKDAMNEEQFDMYIGEVQLNGNYDLSNFFTNGTLMSYGIREDFNSDYSSYKNGDISYLQFIRRFRKNVPFIPLFFRQSVVSVNRNIEIPDTDQGGIYTYISDWKMKSAN